jgi:hypothetical protein
MKLVKTDLVSTLLFMGLLGTAASASATPLYEETFAGGPAGTGQGLLPDLGWVASGAQQYNGWYNNETQFINSATSGPINGATGVYIGAQGSSTLQYVALTTTDTSGAGTYGLTSFSDISLSSNPSLNFSIFSQLQGGGVAGDMITGYFLVQNGGQWYASSSGITPPTSPHNAANNFDPRSLTLSGAAANWDLVTGVGTGTITLGSAAGSDLTGNITGVGFLEGLISTGDYSSWNYADFAVTATPEPTSLTILGGFGLLSLFIRRRFAK